MPPALEYLPVVESEYKPLATSRSGARGLWQFMENSIKPFMEKNEWIDERLDPWKSTDAALSKLQDNYKMFGDWPIAIAAYNCGAGAMQRILKKAPEKTFWYIAEKGLLRDQSVQYVPKFLAISELSENGGDMPAKNGMHYRTKNRLSKSRNSYYK
jgi:membrane-bound lytic murein transglycosylase D